MKIFITGITGTLGQRVAKRCANAGYKVIGLSRCELKAKELMNNVKCKVYIGDIRDKERLREIFREEKVINIIFHFAALKHVDLCEKEINECIKTNVIGTQNIRDMQKYFGVERIIFTSTDKAVYPINVYGNCKAISEKIILEDPANVVCRYGNVLNSRGSVFKMFYDQITIENIIKITNIEMTRFFITIEDAVEFVFNGIFTTGGLHIPYAKMKACSIVDLAMSVLSYINNNRAESVSVKIMRIGMRPGEKVHEDIDEKDSSVTYHQYTKDELYDLVRNELINE